MALTHPSRSPSVSTRPHPPINLADIPLQLLWQQGIRGIILDLDNTILSEDDRYLSPGVIDWLQAALDLGFGLVILSNSNRRLRVERWGRQLGLPALSRARKPFPWGFRRALRRLGVPRSQAVMVGDSWHTDVLGAWLSGIRCLRVASMPHEPHWWEYWVGSLVHRPYPEAAIAQLEPLKDWK